MTVSIHYPSSLLRATLVFTLASAAALAGCRDALDPESNPLAGLAQTTRNDSTTAPPSTTPQTPGRFVGTIYGYVPGPGTDTLQTAIKLQGVQVTAFVPAQINGAVAPGAQVATTTTDALGYFQLPVLPGGEYVVTFVVPQGSIYRSGWTVGEAWEDSQNHPWHIMLPKK